MSEKWPQPIGWFAPRREDYQMKCCRCGLIHSIDHRINRTYPGRDIIQMRVKPSPRRVKEYTQEAKHG